MTADQSPASGTVNSSVSKGITGLTPNSTYHYRVVGVNATGTSNGSDQSFATLAALPVATTDAATNITETTVTLNGSVDAQNASTCCEILVWDCIGNV